MSLLRCSQKPLFLLQRCPRRQTFFSNHLLGRSSFSSSSPSKKEPMFKIPAHIAFFTLLLLPVTIYTAFFYNGKDDRQEDLEGKIRARYGDDVQASTANNRKFAEFYKTAILSDDDDDRIKQVLYAGKGEKKRFHKIDPELYGTEKGVEERIRMEEEMLAEKKRRKEKRKRKKEGKEEPPAVEEEMPKEIVAQPQTSMSISSQTATIASVGILAAAIGFLLGGRRN